MIHVYKLDPNAQIPKRNHPTDGGGDLFALHDVFIPIGSTIRIRTGVAIEIPKNHIGEIRDRSSLGSKGLSVGAGIIDHGFTGEVTVVLHNLTCTGTGHKNPIEYKGVYGYQVTYPVGYQIKAGDKIAQIIISKVITSDFCQVTELWDSERGNKGFGSSGR